MVLSGDHIFALGVAVAVLSAIVTFGVISITLAASQNKRRARLLEARRLKGIPDAIVVQNEEEAGDIETGVVVSGPTTDSSTTSKRKESAKEKRKKKLAQLDIPVGEIYDGAYGRQERDAGLCYSIFTRKSTVLLHLAWNKAISIMILVLHVGFLVISMLRGLYLLSFPQFGIASTTWALLMALYSFNGNIQCCLRWCVLIWFIPGTVASDLMDAATLAVEYACKRDGSPCSQFDAEVVLFFFCLRMLSIFLNVWLVLLTVFMQHELGCCEDPEVHSTWDADWDSKTVSLECTTTKDFYRRKGKSLQDAIRRRKEELKQKEQGGEGGEDDDDAPSSALKAQHALTFISASKGVGRGTKKSVFKQKSPSSGRSGLSPHASKRNLANVSTISFQVVPSSTAFCACLSSWSLVLGSDIVMCACRL